MPVFGRGYEDPYELPESAKKVIPGDLGQDFLNTLDKDMQLQEQKQMEQLLGFQEGRGLMRSGLTNRALVEGVLGPGLERRKQALLPMAMEGAQIGQAQGYETQTRERKFDMQRQFAEEQFQRQLAFLHAQTTMQEQLMQWSMQMENAYSPGFGQQLSSNLAIGLGQGFGGGLGKGIGGGISGGVMKSVGMGR